MEYKTEKQTGEVLVLASWEGGGPRGRALQRESPDCRIHMPCLAGCSV